MIRKWWGIIFIIKNKKEKNCAHKNINFHSYIINRHSFGPKPTCDLQTHLYMNFHVHK